MLQVEFHSQHKVTFGEDFNRLGLKKVRVSFCRFCQYPRKVFAAYSVLRIVRDENLVHETAPFVHGLELRCNYKHEQEEIFQNHVVCEGGI